VHLGYPSAQTLVNMTQRSAVGQRVTAGVWIQSQGRRLWGHERGLERGWSTAIKETLHKGLIVRRSVENGISIENVWLGATKVVELMKSSYHVGNPTVPQLASTRMVRPGVFPTRCPAAVITKRSAFQVEDVSVKKDTFATKGQENVFFWANVQNVLSSTLHLHL